MEIGRGRFVGGVFVYEDGIVVPEGCRIQVTEEISVVILGAKEGERITNVQIYGNLEYLKTKSGKLDFYLKSVAPSEDINDSEKMYLLELEGEGAEFTGITGGSIPSFDPDDTA